MGEWLDETITTQVKIFYVFSHVMVDLGRETVTVEVRFRDEKKLNPNRLRSEFLSLPAGP